MSHGLHIADIADGHFTQAQAQFDGFTHGPFDVLTEQPQLVPTSGGHRQFCQLIQAVDAKQAIPAAQVVVEEAEGTSFGQRHQPDG